MAQKTEAPKKTRFFQVFFLSVVSAGLLVFIPTYTLALTTKRWLRNKEVDTSIDLM